MSNHTSQGHRPLYPFLCYGLLLLGFLTLSRVLLTGWLFSRVESLDNAITILLYGLRFDVIVICILWLIPVILLISLPKNYFFYTLQLRISRIWLMSTTILIVFLELSTPAFIDQYDTRPNRLFFEYLNTPVEVIKTSVLEYPWHFAVILIVLTLLIRYLLVFNRRIFRNINPWPVWGRIILIPVGILILFMGARSTLDHRPANASTAAFTNDQLVNKLGLSSIYTVLTALYELRNEDRATSVYESIEPVKMVSIVRREMGVRADLFVKDDTSTWHLQQSREKAKQPNLVIILEESLGAGFVGELGGVGVTPELDKLSKQGLWFSNLYATGTRSARGIEAIITGFPPSPSRSVLKLGLAQQNFVTLASILRQQGYATQFIYGGESHFDNMAGFFLANGFDRVIDKNDYTDEIFRGTWGVSDEDLFQRLDEELTQTTDQPQFVLAFTSSNHSPFQFPDGRIELHDAEKHTVNNAIKYADYALGQYFKRARTRPYWDNTYFLVVSDHDTRVYGASLVPINKFHIPGLIIGPDVEPENYQKITSQIDLAPTLLGYMGISTHHPMIGRNIKNLKPADPGRAIMQYANNHAYMEGNNVVIHTPQKSPRQFKYQNRVLSETPLDMDLAEIALSHANWAMYAYREGKYLHPK